jgi:hypothetical protein
MSAIETIANRISDAARGCHPLIAKLFAIGRAKTFIGGRMIIQELEFPRKYLSEGDIQWYGGYQPIVMQPRGYYDFPLPRDPSDTDSIFTAAEYPIRQIAIAFHDIDRIDPDSEQVLSTIKNFKTTMAHSLMWNAAPNGIHGLNQFVSSRPTIGVIGGIDQSRHRFWRNLALKVDRGIALTDAMDLMYDRLTLVDEKGKLFPDLILMGKGDFEDYEASSGEEMKSAAYSAFGFKSLRFRNSWVVLDEMIGPEIDNYDIRLPRIYFLNTRYFHWRSHELRNFTVIDEDRIVHQEGVGIVAWAGNLTASCLYAHGVLLRSG